MCFEEKLIEAVRKKEFLYNINDKNYRRMSLKARAWSEIAEELNTSEKRCKTRWKSLRDKYRKLHRIATNSRLKWGDNLSDTKFKWPFFEALSFLNPFEHSTLKQESEEYFWQEAANENVTQTSEKCAVIEGKSIENAALENLVNDNDMGEDENSDEDDNFMKGLLQMKSKIKKKRKSNDKDVIDAGNFFHEYIAIQKQRLKVEEEKVNLIRERNEILKELLNYK